MTKISAIIPIYNVEYYLSKCLDCICNQTLKDIEIICVNDCSPDNCLEILREYASKDERIKIIDLKTNRGVAYARNEGIKNEKGEYLSFIDADDFIDLDFYEKLYNKSVETNSDITFGNMEEIDYTNRVLKRPEIENFVKFNDKYYTISDFKPAIYSKSLIIDNDLKFPEGVILCEDMLFLTQAVVKANVVVADLDTKYYYIRRIESGNSKYLNKNQIDSAIPTLYKMAEILNRISPSNGRNYAYMNILNILLMFSMKTEVNEALKCVDTLYELFYLYSSKEQLKTPPYVKAFLKSPKEIFIKKILFLINSLKTTQYKIDKKNKIERICND